MLLEKLRKIEALINGGAFPGEQIAAHNAKEKILLKLNNTPKAERPVEYTFTLGNMWSNRLFRAIARRYGLRPYRYKGQRYTTVMMMVQESFVNETLWPTYQKFEKILREYLNDVTDRVIADVLKQNPEENDEEKERPAIGCRN